MDLLFQVEIFHKPQFETYHNSVEGVIHHGDQHVQSNDNGTNQVDEETQATKQLCKVKGRIINPYFVFFHVANQ